MSTPDLDAIQARADAATPGPWYLVAANEFGEVSIRQEDPDGRRRSNEYVEVAEVEQWADEDGATAEFIVAAREDIPALIARVRELEATIARMRELARTESWPEDGAGIAVLDADAVLAALGTQETP